MIACMSLTSFAHQLDLIGINHWCLNWCLNGTTIGPISLLVVLVSIRSKSGKVSKCLRLRFGRETTHIKQVLIGLRLTFDPAIDFILTLSFASFSYLLPLASCFSSDLYLLLSYQS